MTNQGWDVKNVMPPTSRFDTWQRPYKNYNVGTYIHCTVFERGEMIWHRPYDSHPNKRGYCKETMTSLHTVNDNVIPRFEQVDGTSVADAHLRSVVTGQQNSVAMAILIDWVTLRAYNADENLHTCDQIVPVALRGAVAYCPGMELGKLSHSIFNFNRGFPFRHIVAQPIPLNLPFFYESEEEKAHVTQLIDIANARAALGRLEPIEAHRQTTLGKLLYNETGRKMAQLPWDELKETTQRRLINIQFGRRAKKVPYLRVSRTQKLKHVPAHVRNYWKQYAGTRVTDAAITFPEL